MKNLSHLLKVIICLVLFSATASAQMVIAIMPFEAGEVRRWYIDRDQMIQGLTDSLTNRMADLEGIQVVERSRIDQIITEQNFGRSGHIDAMSASQIGRLLGANLVVMGTIHDAEMKDSGGLRVGIFSAKGTSAKTVLSLRGVDVETGVILGSVQGSGSHVGASFAVSNLSGISFFGDTFQNSVLGKSLNKAVDELVEEFELVYLDWYTPKQELAGNIVAVVGDKSVLNLGSIHNVYRGDRFEVYELVRVPGITNPVEIPMGTLRVISVDEEASVAEIEDEDGTYEEGYLVRKQ